MRTETTTNETNTATKIVINKETFEAAKAAGEVAEGQTFAQWRQAMKAQAEAENKPVVIGAMPTVADPVITPATDDAAAVLGKVDTAIATVTAAKVVAQAATGTSKAKLARAIFIEELEKTAQSGVMMVRKDVLLRFRNEAGCTEKGANTYLQNLRDEFGLTQKKAKA